MSHTRCKFRQILNRLLSCRHSISKPMLIGIIALVPALLVHPQYAIAAMQKQIIPALADTRFDVELFGTGK